MNNNNKKKILALVLIAIILILAGLAIFVTIQLQKAQVPTAPTSRPRAAEWYGSESCNLSFAVAVPGRVTCSQKEAYKDVSSNSAGSYDLAVGNRIGDGGILDKGQKFVYAINYINNGSEATPSSTITDVLDDKLTFVDSGANCSYNSSERKVTCNTVALAAGAGERVAFRVSVKADAAAGNLANQASVTGSNNCSVTLAIAAPTTTATATAAPTVTATVTAQPTATGTIAPTTTIASTPTATRTVTAAVTSAPTAEKLPEAGILNLPGAAAFGGGLLLTILGILFAL